MKYKLLLYPLFIFGLIVSACSSLSSNSTSKSPEASSSAQKYEVKGKVVSADMASHKVTIAHEEIKGYMEAMTMPFTLLDDWVVNRHQLGAVGKRAFDLDLIDHRVDAIHHVLPAQQTPTEVHQIRNRPPVANEFQ